MPPINLYSLPRQDWFDKLQARPHSRETVNIITSKTRELKKPIDFIRGR